MAGFKPWPAPQREAASREWPPSYLVTNFDLRLFEARTAAAASAALGFGWCCLSGNSLEAEVRLPGLLPPFSQSWTLSLLSNKAIAQCWLTAPIVHVRFTLSLKSRPWWNGNGKEEDVLMLMATRMKKKTPFWFKKIKANHLKRWRHSMVVIFRRTNTCNPYLFIW